MKVIVQTLDKRNRMNTVNAEVIEAFRPSVVTVTELVTNLAMKRILKPYPVELPDTATDSEFVGFYKACGKDTELAIQSFVAKVHKDEQEKEALNDPAKGAAFAAAEAAEIAAAEQKKEEELSFVAAGLAAAQEAEAAAKKLAEATTTAAPEPTTTPAPTTAAPEPTTTAAPEPTTTAAPAAPAKTGSK